MNQRKLNGTRAGGEVRAMARLTRHGEATSALADSAACLRELSR